MLSARKSILIVENERVVAMDLRRTLMKLGYDVPVAVTSAEDAIRACTVCCPHLVLMDIRLDGDADGVEAARLLRERFDVPVIYLTAYADEATVARARLTEPHGYLLKPVNPDELRSAVEVALYKHGVDAHLRERERWFATTLRSIGDAVISTDAEGLVTFMNPVAEQLTGVRSEDASGRPASEVIRWVEHHAPHTDHPIQRVLKSGKQLELNGSILGEFGQEYPVTDSASPILGDAGELLGAVMVLRDVSEQQRMQRQLELADRMSSLGTMAAGVCHEINNPLTFVVGNLGLALRKLSACQDDALRTDLSRLLETCLVGSNRIGQIVRDLRTFSRPSGEQPLATNVTHALAWALQVAMPVIEGRAQLAQQVDALPLVLADETRLSQVFINLLINAGHAIPSGDAAHNHIVVHAFTDEHGWAVIDISDTGSGMSAEVANRIFEPFFTTKQASSGTGLGLSICHGIVASLGGTIDVETAPAVGTRFRVRLPPAHPAARTRPSSVEPHTVKSAPGASVLVVDDEALIREFTVEILRLDGHQVSDCESGEQALAMLQRGQRFDIILCDLMMPGMDGAALYEVVRARYADQAARVFFISGGACSAATVEFLRSATRPLLEKPFSPAQLQDAVRQVLQEHGSLRARN